MIGTMRQRDVELLDGILSIRQRSEVGFCLAESPLDVAIVVERCGERGGVAGNADRRSGVVAVRIDGELAVSLMIALRPEVGSTTKILPPGPSTLKKFDALLPNAMYIPPLLMAAPRLEPASPCVPSASAETSLKCGDEGSVTSTT